MQKSIADYPKVGRKSQQPPRGAIFLRLLQDGKRLLELTHT